MKKLIYSIFAIGAISMTSCGAEEAATTEGEGTTEAPAAVAGTFNTADDATITWKAKHNSDADYVHVGTVPTSGNVVVDNNAIVGGEFTMSIIDLDENGDTEWNVKLEEHLQDSTFFNTAMFPSATFTITGSEAGRVMGNLTVLGVSQPITIEGEVSVTDAAVTVKGSTVVDMLGFAMPSLLAIATYPAEEQGSAPDTNIVIEIDMTLSKAAL